MNALIKHEPTVPDLVAALMPKSIEEAMRLAQFMARSKMVPKHLQDDPGTCLMIIEQATRWRMSPFAVAQCTSSIGGKLMYEGKLTAAAVESIGAIEGHFDYDYHGEGEALAVTVSARRTGDTNPRRLTVKLRDVRTSNEWWRKQPEQQLAYSATRAWARRYTPSAMLGVYAPEEFNKGATFEGDTIEGDIEPEPEPPAPAPEAAPPPQHDHETVNRELPLRDEPQPPRKRTVSQWLDNLEISLQSCQTREDYDLIAHSREVIEAQRSLKGEALNRLWKLLADAADALETIFPEDRLGA